MAPPSPSLRGRRPSVYTLPRWLPALVLACVGMIAAPTLGQMRVVSYNIAHLNGNLNALEDVFEASMDDDKPGFAVAPAVFVFQEVNEGNQTAIGTRLNAAAAGLGVSYDMGTYTNDDENCCAGAQAMFFRNDVVDEITSGHADVFTGAGRNADRWKLQLEGYDSQDAGFYIYSMHLKASQGGSNSQQRLEGVQAVMADAATLPAGSHIIYAGDMNFYSNNEPGYEEFTEPGSVQGIDPLGTGDWGGSSNSLLHTQSPRVSMLGGLVGGGLNDRFDFQFLTDPFLDGEGLSMISGTYRVLGNDGNHYDDDINNGNNTYYPGDLPRSNALADDLHIASDHMPLIADYQIPAVQAATWTADLGHVIVGTFYQPSVTVFNGASVVHPSGADDLTYQATAANGLTGSCNGTLPPSNSDDCMFILDTSSWGAVFASVTLVSVEQGVQNDVLVLPISAGIVRPASPSFSDAMPQSTVDVEVALDADTGTQPIVVPLYNRGWDANQSLLDVDLAIGIAPPYSMDMPLPTGIAASTNLTIHFDTAGLAPGAYDQAISFLTSDEDVPGQTSHGLLMNLSVEIGGVPCPADVTGDGTINVSDLVEVILFWDTANEAADVNDDGTVNVNDLLELILAWGPC